MKRHILTDFKKFLILKIVILFMQALFHISHSFQKLQILKKKNLTGSLLTVLDCKILIFPLFFSAKTKLNMLNTYPNNKEKNFGIKCGQLIKIFLQK